MPSLAALYAASDSDPTPVVEFVRHLAEGFGLPQPLDALDAGCGPGRMLGPLARLGWRVTGLEPDPGFAEAARERARASRRLAVVRGGFLDVEWCGAFDLALAINGSFAHLATPAERADALARLHRALRPGGVVCLDLPDFAWVLRTRPAAEPFDFEAEGRAVTLVRRHEVDARGAVFTTVDEYWIDGQPGPRMVHAYGIITRAELERLLREAGFAELRTFAGYGSPADEGLRMPRMIVAACRP
jgi:SAM-dependent methyltransferase